MLDELQFIEDTLLRQIYDLQDQLDESRDEDTICDIEWELEHLHSELFDVQREMQLLD
jgi:hypothetical protein